MKRAKKYLNTREKDSQRKKISKEWCDIIGHTEHNSPWLTIFLEKLHEGHQGNVKCRRRAVQSVWWPGVSKNIKELIDNCRICCQTTKSHPEPLIRTLMPARLWQRIATALMEFKKVQYLVVVDYYSRYIELSKLESISSASNQPLEVHQGKTWSSRNTCVR